MYAQDNVKEGATSTDTTVLPCHYADFIRIQELMMQIQEMKMNEIILVNETENKNKTDSLKKSNQEDRLLKKDHSRLPRRY